jgi:hypothetical protein
MKTFSRILIALFALSLALPVNAQWLTLLSGSTPIVGGAPTLSSASINSAGTQLTLNWSASCTKTGSGTITISASGGASTPTYSSGSPGTAFVYGLSRTINNGETVTVSYTQPGNDIEATSGGADVATFSGSSVTNGSSVGGVTYLINEGFEGTGTPTAPVTWDVGGSPNYDYTTSPILGAQSLTEVSGDDTFVEFGTTPSTVEARFAFRFSALPSANAGIFSLYAASPTFNNVAQIGITSTGQLVAWSGHSVTQLTPSVSTMSPGTNYVIWVRSVKGTGADQILTAGFDLASSGVRPTSGNNFISTSTGDSVENVVGVEMSFDASHSLTRTVYDDVKIVGGTDTLGSYP